MIYTYFMPDCTINIQILTQCPVYCYIVKCYIKDIKKGNL
jgi:hypothetical protein